MVVQLVLLKSSYLAPESNPTQIFSAIPNSLPPQGPSAISPGEAPGKPFSAGQANTKPENVRQNFEPRKNVTALGQLTTWLAINCSEAALRRGLDAIGYVPTVAASFTNKLPNAAIARAAAPI